MQFSQWFFISMILLLTSACADFKTVSSGSSGGASIGGNSQNRDGGGTQSCFTVSNRSSLGAAQSNIITRHDVPDSDYLVSESLYPALVDLLGRGDCIGSLVHPSYLLTVAHCAAELNVGRSLSVNGTAVAVAEVNVHPQWSDSRDEFDIALVKLDRPVIGVSPLPIYRGQQEMGSLITLVGRGLHATGQVGENGATDDGQLRQATNLVSSVNSHFIKVTFDEPGSAGVTELEGVGAAGDSGGPAFIRFNGIDYIAGLNSWGDGSNGVGTYGASDYQTRVSQYLSWIDSIVDLSQTKTCI